MPEVLQFFCMLLHNEYDNYYHVVTFVQGPNFILKSYGFAIHGCIDGYMKTVPGNHNIMSLTAAIYSRRILWLEVGTTNNDSSVIAYYFLQCVKNLNGNINHLRTAIYVCTIIIIL